MLWLSLWYSSDLGTIQWALGTVAPPVTTNDNNSPIMDILWNYGSILQIATLNNLGKSEGKFQKSEI